MSEHCKETFECQGDCWMNITGDPPIAGKIMSICKGTLTEQKINDDYFNGKINKEQLNEFYKF